jgi:putative DNA primase/helicase
VFVVDGMQPQEQRAARAFALVALAGELATGYAITGWTEGAATDAVKVCFDHWRSHRGVGATEDKVILDAVNDFIDKYGDSRFTEKTSDNVTHGERAGWYSDSAGIERTFFFNAAGIKEAAKGYDIKRVIEALLKAKWLPPIKDGRATRLHKISGRNQRLYEVTVL